LVIVLICLTLLIARGPLTYTTAMSSDAKPLFLGYRSNALRVDPLNLTQLSQRARDLGYNVTVGQRVMDAEWVEGKIPTPECNFQLIY
jgi:hypothetical protein